MRLILIIISFTLLELCVSKHNKILRDRKTFNKLLQCFEPQNNCNQWEQELINDITEMVRTGCARCTANQRKLYDNAVGNPQSGSDNDEVVNNRNTFNKLLQCFEPQNNCNQWEQELINDIIEMVRTGCARCTANQRKLYDNAVGNPQTGSDNDEVVNNRNTFNKLLQCFEPKNNCNQWDQELINDIMEMVRTGCARCTANQRKLYDNAVGNTQSGSDNDEVVNNRNTFNKLLQCFEPQNNCNQWEQELINDIIEMVRTGCARCTANQRKLYDNAVGNPQSGSDNDEVVNNRNTFNKLLQCFEPQNNCNQWERELINDIIEMVRTGCARCAANEKKLYANVVGNVKRPSFGNNNILKDRRTFYKLLECFKPKNNCNRTEQHFINSILRAVRTGCKNCSANEKRLYDDAIANIKRSLLRTNRLLEI